MVRAHRPAAARRRPHHRHGPGRRPLRDRGGRSRPAAAPQRGTAGRCLDLDSARLDVALAALPPHELRFQHGVDNVRAAVAAGDAQFGVPLRPAPVAQIEATAHGGERMPPKTTFFHPKLKTGLVFRAPG